MWPCTSKKDDFIRSSQGSWARTAPKSYGPEPLVGITRRCGHMQTGVLWVICVLFGHGVERYVRVPYRLRKFTCGHPMGLCGFHMGVGTSIRSRADAVRAWEYLYDQWYRALRGQVRTRISHRFSSFWSVWGPWTARDLHVTEVFGWFRTEFPRAIDSYDTQTRKGTRASHVT